MRLKLEDLPARLQDQARAQLGMGPKFPVVEATAPAKQPKGPTKTELEMAWNRFARNKFHAVPVHDMVTGQSFDSTGEHERYRQLCWLQKAGHIQDLVLHPKITLIAKSGTKPDVSWKVDYSYTEAGRTVCEDYKPRPATGRETLMFKLWRHYGPALLRITGKNGKIIKTYMGG